MPTTDDVTTLVNGELLSHVSVFDRGFQYGDGVFETIAVYRGVPLLWERHLDRLARGAAQLGIEFPSTHMLTSEAQQLCRGSSQVVLKIMITRGVGTRGYTTHDAITPTRVLTLSPWPNYPRDFARLGVQLTVCETRLARHPRLGGIKHLNRLEQVLARAEWRMEFAEGLMRDERGDVIEGTMSNVFLVSNGVLRTPDVTASGVAGIMRERVLDVAPRLGITCDIGIVSFTELATATEIFITNSLIGIWPVRRIMDMEYAIGPVTRKIQEAVRETHCFDLD